MTVDISALEESAIAHSFAGDRKAYEASVKEAFREKVGWWDIEAAATTLPEFEQSAQHLIGELLGYLPPAYITVKHEPFLRALLHNHQFGLIDWSTVIRDAEVHIKQMRNQEAEPHSCFIYEPRIYQDYTNFPLQYRTAIRNRLTRFMGYEPNLKYSIAIELILIRLWLNHHFHFPDQLSTTDIQAITTIKYREVLLKIGKKAADSSPLVALSLKAGQMG